MIAFKSLLPSIIIAPLYANDVWEEQASAGYFSSVPREIVDHISSYFISTPKDLMNFSQSCKYLRNHSYKSRSKVRENWLMICGPERPELSWNQYYKQLSNLEFVKPMMESILIKYARLLPIKDQQICSIKFTDMNDYNNLVCTYKNVIEFLTILSLPKDKRDKIKDSHGHYFIENIHDLNFYNHLIFTMDYYKDESNRTYFELSQISSNVDFCRKFVTEFPQLAEPADLVTQENCYDFMLSLKKLW